MILAQEVLYKIVLDKQNKTISYVQKQNYY